MTERPFIPGAPTLPTREEFRDRVAVVTGGTQGLGHHLVETLLGLGARVCFCARHPAGAERLLHAYSSLAEFTAVDLADAAATRAWIHAITTRHGAIDYLVNNAAIDPVAALEQSSLEAFDQIVAIDLRSYFVTTQAALPGLRSGLGKAVVNIGTTNWMLGEANHAMYASAKSGIIGLSRALARELGPSGIRVNVVSPGWIMTDRQLAAKVTPEVRERLLADTSLRHLLGEQHVTPATLFFLSQAAGGISGQNLVVDGGKYFH